MATDTLGIFRERAREVAKLRRAGLDERAQSAFRSLGRFATKNRIPNNVQAAEWRRLDVDR